MPSGPVVMKLGLVFGGRPYWVKQLPGSWSTGGTAVVGVGAPELGAEAPVVAAGVAEVPGNCGEADVGVDDVPGHGPAAVLGVGLGVGVGSAMAVPTVRVKVARQAPAASSKLRGRIGVGIL